MSDFEFSSSCAETNETYFCFSTLTEEQKKYLNDNKNDVVYYKGNDIKAGNGK